MRLKNNDWWPSDAEAQPVWQFCKELYEKRAFAWRHDNEMGVRQEFIDKILERLGFAWSDNLRLPETKQDLEPDGKRTAAKTAAAPTCIPQRRHRKCFGQARKKQSENANLLLN